MSDAEFNFKSWGEFVDKAENGKSDMSVVDRASRETDTWMQDWFGTKKFSEAVDLGHKGWSEGAKRVKSKLEVLQGHLPSRVMRREMAMAQVGPGTIDMQRYIMGHPEPYMVWNEYEEVSNDANGKVISIVFSIAASAGVSTDSMFNKGVVICALTDLLERSGYRVELTLTMSTKLGYDNGINIRVRVKEASDVLDLDRVAFALAHAACFRRLGFSVLEQAPEEARRANNIYKSGGYGRCHDLPEEGAINIKSSDLMDNSYSETNQADWLRLQLANYGIEWETE